MIAHRIESQWAKEEVITHEFLPKLAVLGFDVIHLARRAGDPETYE
jgi:hypothetical protein